MKAHFYRTLRDDHGDLVLRATISLDDPDTLSLLSVPVYSDPDGFEPLGNPFDVTDGVIDIWVDQPQRIRLRVWPEGGVENSYDVEAVSVTSQNPVIEDMVYDEDDNLIEWTEDGVLCSATYDDTTGNLLTYTVGGLTRTYSYDPVTGLMTGAS